MVEADSILKVLPTSTSYIYGLALMLEEKIKKEV
jgi:hypothetical protein